MLVELKSPSILTQIAPRDAREFDCVTNVRARVVFLSLWGTTSLFCSLSLGEGIAINRDMRVFVRTPCIMVGIPILSKFELILQRIQIHSLVYGRNVCYKKHP